MRTNPFLRLFPTLNPFEIFPDLAVLIEVLPTSPASRSGSNIGESQGCFVGVTSSTIQLEGAIRSSLRRQQRKNFLSCLWRSCLSEASLYLPNMVVFECELLFYRLQLLVFDASRLLSYRRSAQTCIVDFEYSSSSFNTAHYYCWGRWAGSS